MYFINIILSSQKAKEVGNLILQIRNGSLSKIRATLQGHRAWLSCGTGIHNGHRASRISPKGVMAYTYLDFKIKSTGLWKFSELCEGEWFGNLVGFNGEHAHRKERGSGLGCLTICCDLLWK